MSLLSAADLEMMRGIIEETLPDTCNILSESLTSDGQGGVTSTWGTATANAACRLDLQTDTRFGDLVQAGGALRKQQRPVLSLSHDVTIEAGNRVEIGGATYTVISTNVNTSWKAVARATLELI